MKRGRFNKALLPAPKEVLDLLGIEIGSVSNGFYMVKCPLHHDNNPSMGVNVKVGYFRCHGCDAKGGDILFLYRQVTGKPFVEACKDLNAWEES